MPIEAAGTRSSRAEATRSQKFDEKSFAKDGRSACANFEAPRSCKLAADAIRTAGASSALRSKGIDLSIREVLAASPEPSGWRHWSVALHFFFSREAFIVHSHLFLLHVFIQLRNGFNLMRKTAHERRLAKLLTGFAVINIWKVDFGMARSRGGNGGFAAGRFSGWGMRLARGVSTPRTAVHDFVCIPSGGSFLCLKRLFGGRNRHFILS